MSIAFPAEPFHEEREFLATLTAGDQVIERLHTFMRYRLNEAGRIVGKIIGDEKTGRALEGLFSKGFIQIKSETPIGRGPRISSEKMVLRRINRTILPSTDPHTVTHSIAEFDLFDATVEWDLSRGEAVDRHITFYLTGIGAEWGGHSICEMDFDTGMKVSVTPNVLDLPIPFEGKVEIRPFKLYDNQEGVGRNLQIVSDVIGIHIETRIPETAMSDDDFIEEAKAITNDVTTLISIADRRRTNWFRYVLGSRERLTNYVRSMGPVLAPALNEAECLVYPFGNHRNEFLKTAFGNLRRYRSAGREITAAMSTTLMGYESDLLEQRFMMFFVALESVRATYMGGRSENLTVTDDRKFRKLKRLLSDLIDTSGNIGIGNEEGSLIKGKLGELRRRAVRSVFQTMFEELNIPWIRAGSPRGGDPMSFLHTRNCLFHGSGEVPHNELASDCDSLQSLTEAVILKVLGWQDITRCFSLPWIWV